MRKFLSLGAAALLMVAFAAPVSAATADSASGTKVIVNGTISIDSPALIDFDSAVPGDAPVVNFFVAVITNNPSGYNVTAVATPMVDKLGVGPGTIPAADLSLSSATLSKAAFGGSPLLVATSDLAAVGLDTHRGASIAAAGVNGTGVANGVQYAATATLAVPYVEPGTYLGTMTFTITDKA